MSRSHRSRLYGLVFAVGVIIAILAACSSAGNSVFDEKDDAGIGGGGDGGPVNEFGPRDTTDASSVNESDACVGAGCGATCGNGTVEAPEACDDGNTIPGDGCSGVCAIEPGYTCPTAGQPCIYTVVTTCGNSLIEGNEACDDGNKFDSDGCSSGCQVEPNYSCTTPGQLCTPVVTVVCGDGTVGFGEQCDDGNALPNEGCSATCTIELGFTCPTPGAPCVKLEYCGDGILQSTKNEACDDGDAVPGDGCSGVCKLEPGYACPAQGQPCTKIWVCGNGKVDPGEACDDSNTDALDGCSADCSLVEGGWTCPNNNGTGGPCTPALANTCGNGVIAGGEQCDDGNPNSNDGCSSACVVEAGYTCPTPGKVCTKIAFCSDGKVDLELDEECDDKNLTSGDGCTATCKREPNYVCPTPGELCVSTVVCGDKQVTGSETCDDGGKVGGDGCSASCTVEDGWQCPSAGARCIAKKCGDGIKAGIEQCDDGDNDNTNGCSNSCKLVAGYACTTNAQGKSVCVATVCGDKKQEGFEQCDDGNKQPYDGCSPTCTVEPQCSGGQCTAVCGDGFKFPQEACDDGNLIDGDGCSSTCTLEGGFTCTNDTQAPPGSLTIPILYRDMRYKGSTNGHPDFEFPTNTGYDPGGVNTTLDATVPYGKPTFKKAGLTLSNATNFCWWYHDSGCSGVDAGSDPNPYAKLVYLTTAGLPTTLTLGSISSNVYQYTSNAFFPINNLGWNAVAATSQVHNDDNGVSENFHFTSELHYPFTYQGGEKFDFTGDDDVWVFINGQLVVDIGGIHNPVNGSITLSNTNNNRCANGTCSTVTMASLGLTVGNMYDIALFQAERHYTGSNYTLTLSGFVRTLTKCTPICGDGKLEGNEVCDDGKNDGSYGSCASDCLSRAPYCGDTLPNPKEACDDGVNQTTYGGAQKVCGPGCVFAPYCGDGVVSNGEVCDNGTTNNTGAYGKCSSSCTLGPRCGDHIVNGDEQCDNGITNGASADPCNADCTLKCGDGKPALGEECDNGKAQNTGGYGKCNPNCTFGPRCGDGLPNGTEQCDDGKNDGSYGTCKSDCTLASYCGDNVVNDPPEACDKGGGNSSSAYGPGLCTNRCTTAPRCGDKAVDVQFGEKCDDGVNSGQPGSCTTDCKDFVPLVSCGNGVVNPPEQCDLGAGVNGTANSACDVHCRFKCGNGFKDPGETCDNGVNDGSYGGCTSNCQIAGYCGDGIKNGPEKCDDGVAGNQSTSTAYGPGICTTACTFAPYCGDGRVQLQFNEQCDGTANCSATCKTTGPN